MEQKKRKSILCLDFDGVLHSYSSGWCGARTIPDPPVPGAIEFLLDVFPIFEVHILSSRSNRLFGRWAMKKWLRRWALAESQDIGLVELLLHGIKWPRGKTAAIVTLDDRCIPFQGHFPKVDELLDFQPWNR